jgi:hypothetical protein
MKVIALERNGDTYVVDQVINNLNQKYSPLLPSHLMRITQHMLSWLYLEDKFLTCYFWRFHLSHHWVTAVIGLSVQMFTYYLPNFLFGMSLVAIWKGLSTIFFPNVDKKITDFEILKGFVGG